MQADIRGPLDRMYHGAATSDTGFSKEEVLNGYRTATAIHFSLHGAANAVVAFPGAQGNNVVTAPEALAALGQRSWRPHVNIIFAGAGFTAGAQATMPPPMLGSNGAYVGFDRLAWILGIQDASVAFWNVL